MLWARMDLLNKYLKGCSPYIMKLIYDLDEREVLLVCAKHISEWIPGKQIKFTDVIGLTEEALDDLTDDDTIDSVMGLYEMKKGTYCLITEKRELMIRTMKNPIGEVL